MRGMQQRALPAMTAAKIHMRDREPACMKMVEEPFTESKTIRHCIRDSLAWHGD
jgi:hypothetical protein